MTRAAVPDYASRHSFDRCPPGHRFNLYFTVWNNAWSLDKDSAKAHALQQVLPLGSAKLVLDRVLARQHAIAEALPHDRRLIVDARSSSPFATGLGLEHPIENGFAFLAPYGLPYLAGSGVKGVLRRAAEELRDDNEPGFEQNVIDALFGPEEPAALGAGKRLRDDERRRGAITVWDVFPVPPAEGPNKDSLVVEIMTPHYTHYYQEGKSPHDAGKPNPIPFLVLPVGSAFRFVVTFEPTLLPAPLPADWELLVTRIFHRAFDCFGFGAKTSVGYGAMTRLDEKEVAAARAAEVQKALRCDWVDETLRELAAKSRSSESEALRGRALAEAWASIRDASLKARALADIRARWESEGWWESPPGGTAKKARAVYDGRR